MGKSALLKQMFLQKPLSEAELMTGFSSQREEDGSSKDMKKKEIGVGDDCIVVLEVWDAVGQSGASIATQFYRESVGIISLYDSTRGDTLEELRPFEEKCKEIRNFEATTCFLAANKIDDTNSDPENSTYGKRYAERNNYAAFYQVSAKRGDNVEDMFQQMAESLLASHKKGLIKSVGHSDTVDVENSTSSNHQRRSNCGMCS